METRARHLERELYQDPDSDCYLFPSEKAFDNATDDLEMIAVSKRSMSLLMQKEAVRNDLEPFKQETKPLAKIWYVNMEDDAHQPIELNSHHRVMKTFFKARYRLSDLLREQKVDRMISSLKKWIKNGAPDKGDLEEDNYRILRRYYLLKKKGRFYVNKHGIVTCRRREEDNIMIQRDSSAATLPNGTFI